MLNRRNFLKKCRFTEMDAQGRGQQPDAPLQEAIYCKEIKKKTYDKLDYCHNLAVLPKLPVARYGADG